MSILKEIIHAILGRSRLDHASIHSEHPRLLHISDTPSQFYSELERIINMLEPEYIIHTGDLADNIKIGNYKSSMQKYKYESKKLLRILQKSNARRVLLSLGNHDDFDFVSRHSKGLQVFDEPEIVELEGRKIAFSHYGSELKDISSDVRLFGHDLDQINKIESCTLDLNGVISINLIDLVTLEVERINYPIGTDDARLNRKKIGF
jgi:predicted MPP superfamily phosphohydrolase